MKTVLHKGSSRGFANHGWLKSFHSFSFANYYNPERMNFGALRVLNDDIVQPKMGFGTHPHQNMEIISIPLKGALSHKDSMGNKRAIEIDEVQVMSAGTGLTHSEFNDSNTEEVNFLQLWVIPEKKNVLPNYEQRKFNRNGRINKLQTIVAPKDKCADNALPISQQAYIYRSFLEQSNELLLNVNDINNGYYIFVIEGKATIADNAVGKRDAMGIYETESILIEANEDTELIIIEVPMN